MVKSIFNCKRDQYKKYIYFSLRILPHQQNTGGFFISLLTKTKNLPWEKTSLEEEAQTETQDEKAEEKPAHFKPPPKKVRRIHGFKEDPFIFMNDDHEIWPQIK
jgi:tRNA (cytosine34-C5)-methyltransferase